MRKLHVLLASGIMLALVANPAAATVTITGVVAGPSVAANYNSVKVPVTLGPGDTLSAVLTYAGDEVTDLDLALFSPFYDSLPLPGTVLEGDPDAIVAVGTHYAEQRVGRTTCTDATAFSQGHLGADGGKEAISVTLGPDAEAGEYALNVIGFLALDSVPFTLTITVSSSGQDVTSQRVGTHIAQGVTNGWAYCDAAGRELVNG